MSEKISPACQNLGNCVHKPLCTFWEKSQECVKGTVFFWPSLPCFLPLLNPSSHSPLWTQVGNSALGPWFTQPDPDVCMEQPCCWKKKVFLIVLDLSSTQAPASPYSLVSLFLPSWLLLEPSISGTRIPSPFPGRAIQFPDSYLGPYSEVFNYISRNVLKTLGFPWWLSFPREAELWPLQ